MIALTPDPQNPDKLILTATVSMYLDKLMVQTLDDQIAQQITTQAVKDLQKNKAVKKAIAAAAQKKLLDLLGVQAEDANGNS